jgi:hypothetical protein
MLNTETSPNDLRLSDAHYRAKHDVTRFTRQRCRRPTPKSCAAGANGTNMCQLWSARSNATGGSSRNRCWAKCKIVGSGDLMVACYLFSGIAEPSPLFESTLPFENNLEYTSKEAFSGVLTRQLGSSEIVLGQVE